MQSNKMGQEQPNTNNHLVGLDNLYCNEAYCTVEEPNHIGVAEASTPNFPRLVLEQDELDKERGGLYTLLSKEVEMHSKLSAVCGYLQDDPSLTSTRQEAVQWILDVNSYHAFSAFTAVLSVNCLDRFLLSFQFWRNTPAMKPWMMQLAAVACLLLAAKVSETHVPLLLDLQVKESKYVFEPKSIQKMELQVLSMLDWKMNPVTPFSFLSYIIEKVPLADQKLMEFSALFEHFVLSMVTDFRFVQHRPSVIAAAITIHVMKQMDFGGNQNIVSFSKNELRGILQFKEENFEACYHLILMSISSGRHIANHAPNQVGIND